MKKNLLALTTAFLFVLSIIFAVLPVNSKGQQKPADKQNFQEMVIIYCPLTGQLFTVCEIGSGNCVPYGTCTLG